MSAALPYSNRPAHARVSLYKSPRREFENFLVPTEGNFWQGVALTSHGGCSAHFRAVLADLPTSMTDFD